jgi:Ala-tRNA(Pro) deacylase
MSEDLTIFKRICDLLDQNGHYYTVLEHEHVHTSADAAKVRGTKLEEAAKALVLQARDKDGTRFFMCVVSGHKRLDLKTVKQLVGSKNVSLADPDDVLKATGCAVGTVPPFPILFHLPGYCDSGVLENEHVVFSAGSNYKSIRMRAKDWYRVAAAVASELS